ncbi:MAG: NAD-dependent epimerase/dehydratase family protein [Angustibacter sp.]
MDDHRPLHVVVGAGPVGTATATLLAKRGERVRIVTRSGGGPDHPAVQRIALDAADRSALADVVSGTVALYNCVNPPYHRWSTDWPPLADSMLNAAATAGAVLVMTGNLYGYGPLDHAMCESDPLAATGHKGQVRARMWQDALAAHRAGRVRAVEVRGSDYYGPGVTDSHLGQRVVPRLLRGRGIRVVGDPDAAHSWSYVPDVARTLVTVAADARAWGRPWHVPSLPARSARSMITELCRVAGVEPVTVGVIPAGALRLGGLVMPVLRELREVQYQFDRPFVMDSSAATDTFGIEPTPLDEALAATITWYRHQSAS